MAATAWHPEIAREIAKQHTHSGPTTKLDQAHNREGRETVPENLPLLTQCDWW
jgi:hypothetical protein